MNSVNEKFSNQFVADNEKSIVDKSPTQPLNFVAKFNENNIVNFNISLNSIDLRAQQLIINIIPNNRSVFLNQFSYKKATEEISYVFNDQLNLIYSAAINDEQLIKISTDQLFDLNPTQVMNGKSWIAFQLKVESNKNSNTNVNVNFEIKLLNRKIEEERSLQFNPDKENRFLQVLAEDDYFKGIRIIKIEYITRMAKVRLASHMLIHFK